MKKLLEQLQYNLGRGYRSALATMIRKEGSSYRSPGAKIIISDNGTSTGLISGGCLEAEVVKAASSVFATGESKVQSFDTRANDDIIFGTGTGCRGKIQIFIELLPDLDIDDLDRIYFGGRNLSKRKTRCLVVNGTGNFAQYTAKRFSQSESERDSTFSILPEFSEWEQFCLRTNKSGVKCFSFGNSSAEIFVDVLNPVPQLHLIGAGQDAVPLHDIAARMGWDINIYDHRPAYAIAAKFPQARLVQLTRPQSFFDYFKPSPEARIVLMSHNFLIDKDYIRMLLPLDLSYIGLLGPKARGQQILEELSDEGITFRAEILKKFHNPIGLNIGGNDPETIALAIVAQIQGLIFQDAAKLAMIPGTSAARIPGDYTYDL